jgi:hypothetical protein
MRHRRIIEMPQTSHDCFIQHQDAMREMKAILREE